MKSSKTLSRHSTLWETKQLGPSRTKRLFPTSCEQLASYNTNQWRPEPMSLSDSTHDWVNKQLWMSNDKSYKQHNYNHPRTALFVATIRVPYQNQQIYCQPEHAQHSAHTFMSNFWTQVCVRYKHFLSCTGPWMTASFGRINKIYIHDYNL